MQLTKFYETQEVLKNRIGYNEPDKLEKLFLALLVEVGECANEQRTWKYWSKNREPRIKKNITCFCCNGTGDSNYEMVQEDAEGNGDHEYICCEDCDGSGVNGVKNPLLEEYVDGFHFILEIGLEIGVIINNLIIRLKYETIEEQFLGIFRQVHEVRIFEDKNTYGELVMLYFGLGEMLGFTDEEIETGYYKKNAINHARQTNGY